MRSLSSRVALVVVAMLTMLGATSWQRHASDARHEQERIGAVETSHTDDVVVRLGSDARVEARATDRQPDRGPLLLLLAVLLAAIPAATCRRRVAAFVADGRNRTAVLAPRWGRAPPALSASIAS